MSNQSSEEEFKDEIKEVFDFLQGLMQEVNNDPNRVAIEFALSPREIARYNRIFQKLANEYNKLSNNLKFTVENVLGIDYESYMSLLQRVADENLSDKEIEQEVQKLVAEQKTYIDLSDNKKPAEVLRNEISLKGSTFNDMLEEQGGLN